MEEQKKPLTEQLERLKKIGDEQGFITYKDITDLIGSENEDLFDEVEEALESEDYVVKEDDGSSDDAAASEVTEDEIDLYEGDLEDEDEEPNDEDLQLEEEGDIKVSDFDNLDNTPYQTDDIVKLYLHEIGQKQLLTITQEVELATGVQNGIVAKDELDHYKKLGKNISDEKRKDLEEKVDYGQECRNELIECNLRLVVSVAKRYTNRGLPLSDLIQEGNMGLMKAVEKYDPQRGFKFSTYATWWIRQSITRAIADKGRNVRIPVHMHESINRLARTKRKLVQELHREPTEEEISAEMKLPLEKVVELERVAQDSVSFDSQVGDEEDSTLMDLYPDETALNPLEFTEKELFNKTIDEVIQSLTPREEMVIRLRYGIGVDKAHTLEEVGKIMGVTRERVRQIETKALQRLRHHQRMNKLKETTY